MEKWKENWHEKILVAIICVSVGIFLIDYAFGRQGVMLFAKMLSFIIFLIPIAVIYWFVEHFKFGKLKNLTELDLLQAEVKKRRYLAEHTVHELSGGAVFHVNHLRGQGNYHSKGRSKISDSDDCDLIAADTDSPPDVFVTTNTIETLNKCDSILIAGGKGAGKTNLAFHLADLQMQAGNKVFIVDPKPQFEQGKWAGARVIGVDHNYSEIISFFDSLTQKMKNDRKQIRVWIDELTILNMQIKKFASLWLPVLIEGREYGKFISIIGQSKTAGSVGLEGRYDLLDCFDAIAVCRHNKASGERFTEIEMAGEGMVIADAPPKFQAVVSYQKTPPHRDTPGYTTATPVYSDVADVSEMAFRNRGKGGFPGASGSGCMAIGMQEFDNLTEEDDAVIRNYRSTGTLNKTIKAVWGSPEKSGKNPCTFAKCKAVLGKFGII